MVRIARSGGAPVWIAVSAAPIRGPDGKGRGAVVTVLDVTQLRGLEAERDTLLHTVSHDLRTPLHVIVSHADLLRRPRAVVWAEAGVLLGFAVVFFAILSAISYFRKFWHKVDVRIKSRRRRELLTLEREGKAVRAFIQAFVVQGPAQQALGEMPGAGLLADALTAVRYGQAQDDQFAP